MDEPVFALFVDVMGVQRELTRTDISSEGAAQRCRDTFEAFHRDLEETINFTFVVPPSRGGLIAPSFVAEFSDAAYIVGTTFETVAAVGIMVMRRALRHRYPLRGGIGIGTFSHETSGVRTSREGQVWSTSSFFGSAIVNAYRAERSPARGLRVFVHETATAAAAASDVTILLRDEEAGSATHELRLWRSVEAEAATQHLISLRDSQDLGERERGHYDVTVDAYARFASISTDIPFATPALWLF